MADKNSAPDTRVSSGAQSSSFKPKTTGDSVDRGGGEPAEGREPLTGASVGGSSNWRPKSGADGPDGSGKGTAQSAAAKPPRNGGGSSGATQKIGGMTGSKGV